jgi:hypothetical protein
MRKTGARERRGDDGFATAAALFGFYAICLAASAYLYWHGTGLPPWR